MPIHGSDAGYSAGPLVITRPGVGADRSTLPTIPGGSHITSAWHARRLAATRYTDLLTADATPVRPASVMVSLLHLHHVRAHGIDPAAEALSHQLARAVALAFTARRITTEGGTAGDPAR